MAGSEPPGPVEGSGAVAHGIDVIVPVLCAEGRPLVIF